MDAGIGTYLVMIARLPYQSSRTAFSFWWWHQDPGPVLMYIAGVDPFPILSNTRRRRQTNSSANASGMRYDPPLRPREVGLRSALNREAETLFRHSRRDGNTVAHTAFILFSTFLDLRPASDASD
jgi:hypothetical protein